jgi:UDP-glucose-4-epimerase GalE
MHVLVTGGAGYIGSVIVARLLAGGDEVTVYDDLSRGHRAAVPPGSNFVEGDVRDGSCLRKVLLAQGCDAIVHMAALAEVGESVLQPDRYREVNVEGTRALVAAAAEAGIGRVVFSSTAAVYGQPDVVPIPEDALLRPTNPYGETKLAAERLLDEAQSADGPACLALRYFNACGADGDQGEDHDPESHLVPLALRAARDGGELAVFGDDYPTVDGTCVRDYVHVADLADAHIAALRRLPGVTGACNLGTGAGATVSQVLDTVERVTGLGLRRRVAPRRPGDPTALVASYARALELLDWTPRRTLDDAVRDAWHWLSRHPDGYGDRKTTDRTTTGRGGPA